MDDDGPLGRIDVETMAKRKKGCAGALANATLISSMVMAADLNVRVNSGGSDTVAVVACGETVSYEVTAPVSGDLDNERLAVLCLT